MRASLIPMPRGAAQTVRASGLTVGLLGSLWFGAACLAEETDKNVARLGFAFDQKAHDAAVAASAASARPDGASDDLLHLAKLVVTEKRAPLTANNTLKTLELAKKTYLSPVYEKTLGPLAAVAAFLHDPKSGFQANNVEAMTLYENEQQKRRNEKMADLQAMAALSDPGK